MPALQRKSMLCDLGVEAMSEKSFVSPSDMRTDLNADKDGEN